MKKTKLMHALLALALTAGYEGLASFEFVGSIYEDPNTGDTAVEGSTNFDPDTYTRYNGLSQYQDPETGEIFIQNNKDWTFTSEESGKVFRRNGDSGDDMWTYTADDGSVIQYGSQGWGFPTPAPEPTPEETTAPASGEAPAPTMLDPQPTHYASFSGAQNAMYNPSLVNIQSVGDVTQSMQNIAQNAYATNNADLMNEMKVSGNIQSSDIHNNMTMNTNAMNSNVGSTYNNSINHITTHTENNSMNEHTTNLDNSRSIP